MVVLPAKGYRKLTGTVAEELYVTIAPGAAGSPHEQARTLYSALRNALNGEGARIFSERIFATHEAMGAVEAERRSALGDLDDGVPPTRVVVSPGRTGPLAGVQVHAVASDSPPKALRCPGAAAQVRGRELVIGDRRWLALNELSAGNGVPPAEQARRMFDCAGCFLRHAGTDMRAVARTWLWLKDICDWYNDFNAARTAFFEREGLIAPGGRRRLPASTGIGLGSAAGAACALDLIALPGREESIELLEAAGEQNSAMAYGSAFSRAAIAPMPGGRTLLVSGTAAVDAQGRTEHVGRTEAQIGATIRHVRSLMAKAGCADRDVLSALVYCKTPEIEEAFHAGWSDLGWPALSMIGDVCRPDLLFEVELVAGPVPEMGERK